MISEPQQEGEYGSRQVEAARRVLVDVGQVLAAFGDAVVVVGGWVPDLLVSEPLSAHVGSIDVDLALDVAKLGDGRYAELLKLLLDTGRYRRGDKDFQFQVAVDLDDGEPLVRVDLEFLASDELKLKRNRPKLLEGFRVLRHQAFAAAFANPGKVELQGKMVSGAPNTVELRVASLPNFIIMKAHAIDGRDKPKDVYDLCYCLDEIPGAIVSVADDWKGRPSDPLVVTAIRILQKKFETVTHYGPRQLADFHAVRDTGERAIYMRRAYELVQALLQRLS